MKPILLVFAFVCAGIFSTTAQVKEIKSASKSSGSSEGGRGSSGGSSIAVDLFFQFFLGNMIQWQRETLRHRDEIPEIVSIDLEFALAAQPSSYYILHPRIRGNWGIFSSDFRLNYLVEEDIEGVQMLRTNDWQVIEINFVNSKEVKTRLGAGIMQEAFGDYNVYPEWTAGFDLKPLKRRVGGSFEYRNAEVRAEVSGQVRYAAFDSGRWHGQLMAGIVYQRYYREVTTWGFQGGIAMKFY